MMRKAVFVGLCLVLTLVSGIPPGYPQTSKPPLKILFIGNSLIYTNDLPDILKGMLKAKGRTAVIQSVANPGWSLFQHSESSITKAAIEKDCWDYIVLQEQSALPTNDDQRRKAMVPAIKGLKSRVKQECSATQTVLFLTWGYQGGLVHDGLPGFDKMQAKLTDAINTSAAETGTKVVPVGTAWKKVYDQAPTFSLWMNDGVHPSLWGTYLSACVLYQFVTGDDPRDLPGSVQLTGEDAVFLKEIAAQVE